MQCVYVCICTFQSVVVRLTKHHQQEPMIIPVPRVATQAVLIFLGWKLELNYQIRSDHHLMITKLCLWSVQL